MIPFLLPVIRILILFQFPHLIPSVIIQNMNPLHKPPIQEDIDKSFKVKLKPNLIQADVSSSTSSFLFQLHVIISSLLSPLKKPSDTQKDYLSIKMMLSS